jgi:hypothetical protein
VDCFVDRAWARACVAQLSLSFSKYDLRRGLPADHSDFGVPHLVVFDVFPSLFYSFDTTRILMRLMEMDEVSLMGV